MRHNLPIKGQPNQSLKGRFFACLLTNEIRQGIVSLQFPVNGWLTLKTVAQK